MATKSRRPKGTGTLSQRADGLWVGRVDAGYTPTGTRRRLTVSSRSKAQAQAKLHALQTRIAAGEVAIAGSARATVRTWADAWLPLHATTVRPTTYVTDAGTIRKWVVPTIGHRRLADLTPADMRALRTAITSLGRSTTTALHAHRIVVKMLRDAVDEGHVVPPRVLKTRKPGMAASDRSALPVDQAAAVLHVALARPDAPRWVSALLQGLRQGESLGLTWDCIDFDRGLLDVSWQLQRLGDAARRPDRWEERHLTGTAYLTRPKTAAGRRVIPLVPWLHAALEQARHEAPVNEWGLVWADAHGRPIWPQADRQAWRDIQAQAGVAHPSGRPWHLHETRHTTVSLLLAGGVDRAVIEAIVGHARLVDAYAHVDVTAARAALEGLAHRLSLPSQPGQVAGA